MSAASPANKPVSKAARLANDTEQRNRAFRLSSNSRTTASLCLPVHHSRKQICETGTCQAGFDGREIRDGTSQIVGRRLRVRNPERFLRYVEKSPELIHRFA